MVARAVRHTGSAGRFAPPLMKPTAPAYLSIVPGSLAEPLPPTSQPQKDKAVTAESISDRLLQSFGEVAMNDRAKQTIASEVNNYLRLGNKHISDNDIEGLEARIRGVLAGAGPTRTTKVMHKRATAEADEWARLYAFQDELSEQADKERRRIAAEKEAAAQAFLGKQVAEGEERHRKGAAEELAYAHKTEEAAKAWQLQEAAKDAQRKQAMLKLKASVQEQLAERQAKKKLEATLRQQEEQGTSAAMAAELKAKMEAEAEAVAKAKTELRNLLFANEVNKAIREKQRQEEQALERKYAREHAEKLDREEEARVAQLAKRAEYQAKRAAIAQQLPESKLWIDPEIIERNLRAREAAEERKESECKRAAAAAREVFKTELAQQLAARQASRDSQRVEQAREQAALETTLQKEKAAEQQEEEKARLKRKALHKQLDQQLAEALARKLQAEPAMTETEREINADMLRRMHAAEAARNALMA